MAVPEVRAHRCTHQPYRQGALPLGDRVGAPRETRTPDHLVRSQVLYPTELWARISFYTVIVSVEPQVATLAFRGLWQREQANLPALQSQLFNAPTVTDKTPARQPGPLLETSCSALKKKSWWSWTQSRARSQTHRHAYHAGFKQFFAYGETTFAT